MPDPSPGTRNVESLNTRVVALARPKNRLSGCRECPAIGVASWCMVARQIGRVAVLVAVIILVLPASGQTRLPPEDDGSTYSVAGSNLVRVDVQPWGGGYVRSTPYLVDCPLACIRSLEPGRELMLTAYPTSGFTFESWTGACAGQPNPCKLPRLARRLMSRRCSAAIYVPPAPPGPAGPLADSGRLR